MADRRPPGIAEPPGNGLASPCRGAPGLGSSMIRCSITDHRRNLGAVLGDQRT
jgi:hypothetical protein